MLTNNLGNTRYCSSLCNTPVLFKNIISETALWPESLFKVYMQDGYRLNGVET